MVIKMPVCSLLQSKYWFGILAGIVIIAITHNGSFYNYDIGHVVNFATGNQSVDLITTQEPPIRKDVQNQDVVSIDANVPKVSPTILCWIVTHPGNYFKAKVVNETWGRKCDKLIFISSKPEPSLPTVVVPLAGNESRLELWNKAKFTFQYVYDNYLNDYEWFFKADDDTYVIMENLRKYASTMNSSLPYFLGRRYKTTIPGGKVVNYLTGGAGYLMTREVLRRLVERGMKKGECSTKLRGDGDDIILGICMERLGAIFGETRDKDGRQRFLQHFLEDMFNKDHPSFKAVKKHDFYPPVADFCCSKELISFHYASGPKAQQAEFLLYQLNVADNVDNSTSKLV